MKRVAIGLMIVGSLALGGCQSDDDKGMFTAPKPLDKMSTEEWCAFYAKYVADPNVSAKNKQVDLERMRSRNCPMPG